MAYLEKTNASRLLKQKDRTRAVPTIALCSMLFALCSIHFALCSMPYALCQFTLPLTDHPDRFQYRAVWIGII